MNRSLNLACLLPLLLFAAWPLSAASGPNVVIILADDLGYGDPRCYNPQSKIPTPHIDRLAATGLRFTDAHTPSSVCTPTRYTLLTGRYCWRTRLTSGVLDGFSPPLIEPDRPTIASWLKQQGYATVCFGKWHLGMQWTRRDGSPETEDRGAGGFRSGEEIDFARPLTGGPRDLGFETYFGISASLDMPPYCWIENDRCSPAPDGLAADNREALFLSQTGGVSHSEFPLEGVLPALKRRTTDWIDRHFAAAPNQPFFLYLPLNSPHLPVVPSAAFRGTSGAGEYGDFVVETDDFVGGVVGALRRHAKLDDTLIVFTSDNGGLWHQWDPREADDVASYKPTPRGEYTAGFGHHSNADLRGTKADIYEGGHRVPFIVTWPRTVSTPRVVADPIELTDLFATVADAVAQPLPAEAAPDSLSFARLLGVDSAEGTRRETLVHHSLQGVFAVRRGGWKYVESRGSGGFSTPKAVRPQPREPEGQLYDLASDPLETRNVFLDHPDRVAELSEVLISIRAGDRLRP